VVLCLFAWAAAKFYIGVAAPENWYEKTWSAWQIALIAAASIAYAGAGASLFLRRWLVFGFFIIAALFLNNAHFAMIASGSYLESHSEVPLVFSLAVVGEEYFIWTLAVAGGLALWLWPKISSSGRPGFSW
jgi:NADH:ubiquinone oxidoreductase subunit K